MTNTVAITIKATDATGSVWTKIKADAAKAGAAAADEFNRAFKLKADANVHGSSSGGGDGLLGSDSSILSRMKSYANTPGGIGLIGTGSDTSLVSMLKNQIRSMGESGGPALLSGMSSGGGQSTTDMVRQVLQNSVTGNTSSDDFIKQVLTGAGPSNVTTSDIIKQVLEGAAPGNVSTSDYIKQVLTGSTPGDISTKDVIHPTVDDSDIADLGKKDGDTYGTSFASSLKDKLGGLLGGGGGSGASGIGSLLTGGGGSGDGTAVTNALDSGGVAGGALPGVAGVSGMAATVTGLAGALVAVLPAITSVVAGLGAIGGGFAILESTNKKFAADMTSTLGSLKDIAGAAAAPLAKPLEDAATQIVGYFKQIEPDLKMVFADSATLIQPLVKGFEALMSGAGPGFLAMIKAAGPVFQSVSGAFADLGKSLGSMFSDFASDGAGSATILSGFLGIINSLLPFIGELGKVMVSALAPAFSAFSGALSEVLPALKPLLSILGSFAGAVLTDLGGVLGSIGTMLTDLAPSFTTLAKVAANLFNTLENTGVFAIVGDALENLAGPIANLVNALVKGLAPALPGIINLIGQMSTVVITLVSDGLGVLINALASVVKWMTPVLPLILDAVVAWKAATIAVGLFNTVMDMNPFIAIGAAVVVVTGLIIKYHTQILDFIEATWNTVFSFLKSLWGDIESFAEQWWPLLLGPAGIIVKYHNDVENSIKGVWNAILSWLKGIWSDISSAASSAWNGIWSAVKSAATTGLNAVETAIGALPGTIEGLFKNAGTWLLAAGKDLINGLLSGAESVISDIGSWVDGIGTDIVNAVKHFFGINSPSTVFAELGGHMMTGLLHGMIGGSLGLVEKVFGSLPAALEAIVKKGLVALASLPGKALSALGSLGSDVLSLLGLGGSSGGSSGGSASPPSASPGSVQALMQSMAAARGWTGQLWTDLYNVEMREAGFNLNAQNPGSDAYGLAQFINGPSEYYQYGGNPNTAAGQITGMLNYIADRYGSPAGAWASELANGYYANGGATSAGWAMVGEHGAELLKLPGGANVTPAGATAGMMGGGNINITLEVTGTGNGAFDAVMLQWLRQQVRVKGGGNVQAALGRT